VPPSPKATIDPPTVAQGKWVKTPLGAGPPGYAVVNTKHPPKGYAAAVNRAWEILHAGIHKFGYYPARGYGQSFSTGGTKYFGRIEVHDHPPLGKHDGTTLYVLKPGAKPL
jgi:hypothetical protein